MYKNPTSNLKTAACEIGKEVTKLADFCALITNSWGYASFRIGTLENAFIIGGYRTATATDNTYSASF